MTDRDADVDGSSGAIDGSNNDNKGNHVGPYPTVPMTCDTGVDRYFVFPAYLLEYDLTETQRLACAVMHDRARLSQRNGYVNEDGEVYIFFKRDDLGALIGKGHTTIGDTLNALENVGLIRRERLGKGQANKIYIKIPVDHAVNLADQKTTDGRFGGEQESDLTAKKPRKGKKNSKKAKETSFSERLASDTEWLQQFCDEHPE